uniref:T-complex protein 1 subunit zeta n=1 Tax=Florenciella parvula TaxID=236787 RepID=A0A7S2BN96_9STRA|eukprot:CAMPEP_0182542868 /NCGR_PEP_ID=MMETSP1323-20130603/30774_1 /TAXON_ID=236787 /ORGANISM="Florenciella parvula, Strain RCC1693" /LENGTH=543 /DNA_ID=CAMNT_0024753753 /DNA_START=42 /DNA_END=1673 /DNA_ORIENTATION=+
MAAATKYANPDAEVVSKAQALLVNCAASNGLQNILKTNLGPRGTLKMLVGGAGQIKITKDGNVLLHEMQIQHPTAMLIARTATAQDDITGDGTTSAVLLCGELLKQAERQYSEGLHPRVVCDGYDLAKDHVLTFLEGFKTDYPDAITDRELLANVARCSLRTKLQAEVADLMVDACVDAIQSIAEVDKPIDLHMVEIMTMKHKLGGDSKFVRGLVLDHGTRHPDMPSYLENCFICTCNVSFEYEKSEVATGFLYSNAEERQKLVESERKFTDEKVGAFIELKRQVCTEGQGFVIINQKGIDPMSLDMLAKEGIFAVRRAKRRNMERVTLACGGTPVNSEIDLEPSVLGWAGKVYEEQLGDDKFTFIEDVKAARSCTILIKGPNTHTIDQIKDAVRDGLRATKNCVEDKAVVAGAGAFETAAYTSLMAFKGTVSGKAKLGVQAYADAMLIIPKVLSENSGFDVQDSIIALQEEHEKAGAAIGLDLVTGECILPAAEGIWDNYRVKRQYIHLSTALATQLLLVDEVMRAGKKMGKEVADPMQMDH